MPLLRLVLALAYVGLAAAEFELEYLTNDDNLALGLPQYKLTFVLLLLDGGAEG